MYRIDGKTRVCGIIANPVEHSLSPVLHNILAQEMEMDRIYVPFKTEKEGLKDAVKGAYALNVLGLNVSIPYKQQVMEYLVEIERSAREIGAVNTLVRVEGGYKGYNTDILGLKKAMELEGIAIKNQDILILGAGGASKAAAYLCCMEKASKIYLLNRTYEKAEREANELNRYFGPDAIQPMSLSDYTTLPKKEGGYLAIQTTNVGMSPNKDAAVIEDEAFYRLLHTGYDLIYTPFETKFMRLSKRAGAKTYNGLRMLLYQGIVAYEFWNQVHVKERIAEHGYNCMKEELGL